MIFRCDECGIRYAPEKNISYKHRHFCSFKCKEDFIDEQAGVNQVKEEPQGDLFAYATDNVGRFNE